MYNIVERYFNISMAVVRSRGESLVTTKIVFIIVLVAKVTKENAVVMLRSL
jgi:hypothetical protein